ncbi:hypothetical protein AAG747_21390 [Rapidithrix thailandica]|uniref:Carboxypeptidase regulatory-like domain-containing protein n=1 Tax=Rapidithrix thailandica TaxID=413964 RepID=A0AAW9SGU4_9BACT
MKSLLFFLTLLLTACSLTSAGQTKTIAGKVICTDFPSKHNSTDHAFWNASGAVIFGNDSIRLGTADENGEFEFEIPKDIRTLRIGWVGMDPEQFELTGNCDFLEVILLPGVYYEFMTVKKEKRLRKKDRKVLPALYQEAVEQKIFKQKVLN